MLGRLRAVFIVTTLAVIWAPALALATAGDEDRFLSLVAAERRAAGLAAYSPQPDLADVARRHAQRMAAEGRLYHNPRLTDEVENWQAVGENVGRGPSVDEIHRAFMNSPSHRREILSTDFTQVGIGVAIAGDGEIWVAEVFRQPMAAPAARPAPVAVAAATPAAAPPRGAPRAGNAAASRAGPPKPTTAPVDAPPAPDLAAPDLSSLDGAFDPAPVLRDRRPAAAELEAPAPGGRVPEVELPVRIAASLLVLVVAGQFAVVVRSAGGLAAGLPWATTPRPALAASAATLR